MRKLLIRHGQTPANRINRAVFGAHGAGLTENGIRASQDLGGLLAQKGLDTDMDVAVSTLVRTQQTASYAGYDTQTVYPILDELPILTDPMVVLENIVKGVLPDESYSRAEELLLDPPEPELWFTHGLVIAGLRETLDLGYQGRKKVPHFCEITEISI